MTRSHAAVERAIRAEARVHGYLGTPAFYHGAWHLILPNGDVYDVVREDRRPMIFRFGGVVTVTKGGVR